MSAERNQNKIGLLARLARWRVVVLVGLLSTVIVAYACGYAWQGQVLVHRRHVQDRVDGYASAISDRINHFKVALEMARGLIVASHDVQRDEWQAFTTSEGFFNRVPGAYGFAYVQRVKPEGLDAFVQGVRSDGMPGFEVFDTDQYEPLAYEDYAVIKYVEPVERNKKAIGLNVASIPASSDTMWRSVDESCVAVSRSFRLHQTGESQAGIVLYLPVYPMGSDLRTVASRRQAVTGWVAVSIAMADFLAGDWASSWHDLDIVLCEETREGPACELFVSPQIAGNPEAVLEAPVVARYTSEIAIGDWAWVLHGRDPHPSVSLWSVPVMKVGVAGGMIGLLLVLLTWSLTRTRDRAQWLARELTSSLRDSEQRYTLAVNGSQDGLWDWDLTTGRVYYAPRWKELLGLAGEDISDRPDEWFGRIVSSDLAGFHASLTRHIEGETDCFDIEVEMNHADGTTRWMLCRAAAVRDADGCAVRVAGSLADITDLKQAQDELRTMAHHDRLTGLANRTLLTDRLTHSIARTKRNPNYHYAVLFLDLDRFKVINDSMGHGVGDRLLEEMARRILKLVREVDTVARFGGDEFVVLVDGVRGVEEAQGLSERLLASLAQPYECDACEVESTVSIGVVGSEFGYERADEVIRDADAAMYQAKAEGKARYCLFDSQMHTQAVRRLRLERDLRLGDFDGQFQVYYQPLVNLDTSEVSGFEALVRWDHPEYGRVMPDEFIGISEETGAIVELGRWVMAEACRQLVNWRSCFADAGSLKINVNLSKRQLMQADILDVVKAVLAETGLPATALKLEVTESTVMGNTQRIIAAMQDIRELGVRLSMDDFGTGHSSLSCLHQFPIDELKIDRSFIVNMQEHREFAAVMDAIVTLAHFLRLDVVAEGIENGDQLTQLQAMDCRYGQGYLFAKPMPANEATAYLSTHFSGARQDSSDAA